MSTHTDRPFSDACTETSTGVIWASGLMGVDGGGGDDRLSPSLLLSNTSATASSHVGLGGILAGGVAWVGSGVGSEVGNSGGMFDDSGDSACARLGLASRLCTLSLAHIFCRVANVSSLISLIRGWHRNFAASWDEP